MLQAVKNIGTELATTGLIGAGVGIGIVFGALMLQAAKNFSFTKIKITILIIQNYLIINNHKIHFIIIISRYIILSLLLLLKLIFFLYNNLGYETYLYFLLTNYIYENSELTLYNWPPKPHQNRFVPKIPIGGLPGSGGPGGPPGPPYDFHTYLAINNDSERDGVEEVNINSTFHKYFPKLEGSKDYTGLGLKGKVHYKYPYEFERAEIYFPTKTKIEIYDERTFCRHVLAHNYWVNLQTDPKDYIRECTRIQNRIDKINEIKMDVIKGMEKKGLYFPNKDIRPIGSKISDFLNK